MSSKHTRVSRAFWTELQQQLESLDAYMIHNEQQLRQLQQAHQQALQQIQQAHLRQVWAAEQAICSLGTAYRTMLQNTGEGLQEQLEQENDAFQRQLQALLATVADVSHGLERSDRRLDALANSYDGLFREQLAREESRQQRAALILAELDRQLQQMEPLQPQRFRPVEYATLQTLRNGVRQNMTAGDDQAAIALSQGSILRATRLLAQLTVDSNSFSRQLEAVRTRAANLAHRVSGLAAPSGVLAVELQGQRQEFDYDINYWSHGEFSRLQGQLIQLQSRLASEELSPGELRQLWEQVDQLQGQLEQCDRQARSALAGTVFVEETADRLRQALEDRGWEAVLDGHHSEDAREPYTLELSDGSGNTVSLVVSRGVQEDQPVYSLEVYSGDEYRAAGIKDGIHSAMDRGDTCMEQVETRDDCYLHPDPETFRQNMVAEAQRRQRC